MKFWRGIALLTLVLLSISVGYQRTEAAGLSQEFGVIGGVSSLPSNVNKQTAANLIAGAGMGWNRQEFTYANNIDFTPYDTAQNDTNALGIKTLGLLTYPGSGTSQDQWKTYVSNVVNHYGSSIPAWEIMNEVDNDLTADVYATYLHEAHDIIKAINPNAIIVFAGLTSRIEATSYWDAVAAAGGWNYFDKIGLHIYHDGNPEKVNFGGGDITAEIDRVVADINKNGGGKNIWITETGYQASVVGETDQANWLARTLVIARSKSSVEKIFIYRLYDNSDSYGLTTSDFTKRPAYDQVKTAVLSLAGLGSGSRLYPQSKTVIDALESTSGWSTDGTTNGTANLSTVAGYSGNAMQINYNFNASSAYAIAGKNIPITGTPQAISAWFYGDNTTNVWKFRFVDKNGETFQADLGSMAAGWTYKQFTFGSDTAFTSWGGDGVIDFPISFNSFVIDHQGSVASGSGIVDQLTVVTAGADLYAYRYSNTVAYWKAFGTGSATLCGASRDFAEQVAYVTVTDCSDTPTSQTGTTLKKSAKKTVALPVKALVDPTKSSIRIDGNNIPADGENYYQIVITVRDKDNNILLDRVPSITPVANAEALRFSQLTLIGGEWISRVVAQVPGDYQLVIAADGIELGKPTVKFITVFTDKEVANSTNTPTIVSASYHQLLPEMTLLLMVIAGWWVWWFKRIYRHWPKLNILYSWINNKKHF